MMSKIRNIPSANEMPIDLAKKLGRSGIIEVISVMWDGYHDIFSECIITPDMQENTITQEWFIRVSSRWNKENRAARIRLSLTPVTQYEDDTLAKPIGQPPTIDFCLTIIYRGDMAQNRRHQLLISFDYLTFFVNLLAYGEQITFL